MEEKKNEFTFEDYKAMLDKVGDTKRTNFILAEIAVIEAILVDKGFITHEKFMEKVNNTSEKIMKIQYDEMSDDEKSMANTVKSFSDLFGGSLF